MTRVYPSSYPKTAGIGSSATHDPKIDKQKRMDGSNYLVVIGTAIYSLLAILGYFFLYIRCVVVLLQRHTASVPSVSGWPISHCQFCSFPPSHVHIHKLSMVLDSAKCNEELNGLRGQQKSVWCTQLAPVFQPHCPRQYLSPQTSCCSYFYILMLNCFFLFIYFFK